MDVPAEARSLLAQVIRPAAQAVRWGALQERLAAAHAAGEIELLAELGGGLAESLQAGDPETRERASQGLERVLTCLALLPNLRAVQAVLELLARPGVLASPPRGHADGGARRLGTLLGQRAGRSHAGRGAGAARAAAAPAYARGAGVLAAREAAARRAARGTPSGPPVLDGAAEDRSPARRAAPAPARARADGAPARGLVRAVACSRLDGAPQTPVRAGATLAGGSRRATGRRRRPPEELGRIGAAWHSACQVSNGKSEARGFLLDRPLAGLPLAAERL